MKCKLVLCEVEKKDWRVGSFLEDDGRNREAIESNESGDEKMGGCANKYSRVHSVLNINPTISLFFFKESK